MFDTSFYLRCERDHPNQIPMRDRHVRVGTPCTSCGKPLVADQSRERPPFRGRF